MNAICAHADSITITALPDKIAGCADCLAIGGTCLHVALACERQRDRAHEETVADVVEIVLTERLLKA